MMLSAGNGFIMQSEKYSRDNAGQSLKKYILLKQGELAYNHGASKVKQFGCCYELTEPEARIPYVYHCFKINEDEYTPYVAMALNNAKMDQQLKRLVSSSVRMDGLLNISFEDYMSVTLNLPSFIEQKHIADFLTKLDERIAYQERLITSLKKYKRGLSDELFGKKETTEEWTTVPFSEAFELLQNNTFSRDEMSSESGIAYNIHYGDVLIKYRVVVDLSKSNVPYIRSDVSLSKFAQSSYLRNGDIVIADTAEDYTVGKAVEIVGVADTKALSGLHTIPCRPKISFAPMYLGYFINSKRFRTQILPLVQGTKVSSISKSEIQKTSIAFPSFEVQSQIASMLYALDHRIDICQACVQGLVRTKEALLQQLFI